MQFVLPQYQALAAQHDCWLKCTACKLHERRRNVVPWRGCVPCDICFVGEAPGMDEDIQGEPFVGEAGRRLDQIVTEAIEWCDTLLSAPSTDAIVSRKTGTTFVGNSELKYAITNTIACVPLENERYRTREPLPEEMQACLPRLVEFIFELAQPKAIVAVGKIARNWLKKLPPHNMKIVEMEHPASILRCGVGEIGEHHSQAVTQVIQAIQYVVESR